MSKPCYPIHLVDPKCVNKRNIDRMIKVISGKEPVVVCGNRIGFNMASFFGLVSAYEPHEDYTGHHCGTTACIAGHAEIFMQGRKKKVIPAATNPSALGALAEFFNVPYKMAQDIAYPHLRHVDFVIHFADIPPDPLIAQLKHLRDTGELLPLDLEYLRPAPVLE